ncbi:CYTH domain-containing protein [Aestuariibacter sp. AA17]|uniref:CYTH domain-containing protein n=1 Tax=Fluctibacter corallii TaxID=2984329 RepID=A0ABT3A7K2_9ALTE|nr:CYTH domain-containing protein [Aestuariibacter sp. AA17]MCV2884629.1 CYTH domain-containing protein [Aestuariibacter sp. AA17]
MATELELKLIVSGDAKSQIENRFLPSLDAKVTRSEYTLFNQYYDTPDNLLRRHDIGLRIRGRDGKFEQTIKTAGKVVAGLHSRPEYNVDIREPQPDLSLFDREIFPESLSVDDLQKRIQPLFTTDFTRSEFLLDFGDKGIIELVCDLGTIRVDKQSVPISEVELELKQGDVSLIFELAERLSDVTNARVGNMSKAARGYMLAKNRSISSKAMDAFLSVDPHTTCEEGFIRAAEYALAYWQHHESCYLEHRKVRDLAHMVMGMQLLLQTLTLLLPLLQCRTMLDLHKALMLRVTDWFWVEQLMSIKELRSKKGPFRKKLSNNPELLSYLRGISEGIIQNYAPDKRIESRDNVALQLKIARTLYDKPWRQESSGYDSSLIEHAKGWLSQGWHNILQNMPRNKRLNAHEYIAQQSMLRQTLFTGFILGNLFPERRDQFRAPWLDILSGIEELNTLFSLKAQLNTADIQGKDELMLWCDEKVASLLNVMEQSRAVALGLDAYW